MKLIHTKTLQPVKIGDAVTSFKGDKATIAHFLPPHKPSSSGHVSVKYTDRNTMDGYNYVGVWGLEWIDREDRRASPDYATAYCCRHGRCE